MNCNRYKNLTPLHHSTHTSQFGNDRRFALLKTLPKGQITGVCVVDDARFAFCNADDGFVYIYSMHEGKAIVKLGGNCDGRAPQRLCSNGSRIYVCDEVRSQVREYDAKTFALIAKWGSPSSTSGETEVEKG